MPKHAAREKAVRREYGAIKKLYNQIGRRARGKPKSSAIYRDYKLVKREYKKVGQELGRITGRKPRR